MIQIKKTYTIMIFVVTLLILLATGLSIYHISYTTTHLDKSHVFICDNSEHKSDFDNWLLDELQIDWVPTYMIINDKKIIGIIDGNITEKMFSDQLGTILAKNESINTITDIEVTNYNGERIKFSSIIPDNDLYFIEISWAACKDCKNQDNKYTKSIYSKYSPNNFYRYYINTDKSEIISKYE